MMVKNSRTLYIYIYIYFKKEKRKKKRKKRALFRVLGTPNIETKKLRRKRGRQNGWEGIEEHKEELLFYFLVLSLGIKSMWPTEQNLSSLYRQAFGLLRLIHLTLQILIHKVLARNRYSASGFLHGI